MGTLDTVVDKGPCPFCDGKGYHTKIDLMQAKSTREECKACYGTGRIPDVLNGLCVEPLPGNPMWLTWYEDGARMAWAKIRLVPVMGKNANGEKTKHLVIEIDWIEVSRDHRRQGLAKNLIIQMQAFLGGEIKYIITGWAGNTDIGRKLFLRCGFSREGKALVWKRDKGKEENG